MLGRLPTCELIDLSSRSLQAEHIFNLAKALEWNISIKKLVLDNNIFIEQDEWEEMTIRSTMAILSLAKMIKRNTCLTSLSLKQNKINGEGLELLADALKGNNNLKNLYIDNNCFTDKVLSYLFSNIASSFHRVFPLDFLGGLLSEQPLAIQERYAENVYRKNEACVNEKQENTEELLDFIRAQTIELGQIPAVITVKENPSSEGVETKISNDKYNHKKQQIN